MMSYDRLRQELAAEPRRWLITGVAGFIGSHLLEALLGLDQTVVGLDNLSTGTPANLEDVRQRVTAEQWDRFTFHQGTVADMGTCRETSNQADYVLHQAGFVSVPLSIEDPIGCHTTNVTGTLNLLTAARDNRVRRVVYASSSAVYGDDPRMPKREAEIGRPLSPYGASKVIGECYGRLFHDRYGLETIGLRYFNIFGPRQDPKGGYAAVIPQWISRLLHGEECTIYGDGSATRDFCPVADVVQANLLAATSRNRAANGEVFNVAIGHSITLRELYGVLAEKILAVTGREVSFSPRLSEARPGDILHSAADIEKIREALGFAATKDLSEDLEETIRWYLGRTK